MTASTVRTDQEGTTLLVTIERPEVHNALDADVLDQIRHAVEHAASAPELRCVVITGSGTKAFSAGADLHELSRMGPDEAHRTMRAGQEALRAVAEAPVPVIAAVNGLALGGGFELVLAATFPVLSERAALGLPESSLGLMPGYGGTQRLPRLVGRPVALHLMLTGHRLDADRAHALGLTPVPPVAPEDLLTETMAIATRIGAQGPGAVRSILEATGRGGDGPLAAGLAVETGLAALAIAGAESTEGIAAFLERRSPDFATEEPA